MKQVLDADNPAKKGKLLASGHGFDRMMKKSYENHWTVKNTVLEIDDPTDMYSGWKMYERK